jgi:hypothetical protein
VRVSFPAFAAALLLIVPSAYAEEGGTGHYLPGSMASFLDATPTSGSYGLKLNAVYYDGSLGRDPITFAGLTLQDVKAESYALGLVGFWSPKLDLPEQWSYATAVAVPYVWVEVEGTVSAGGLQGRKSDSINGFGDILLFPLMLTYAVSPDFKVDGRLGIYAPTGRYKVGRLANTGKNYWTFEPALGLYYFGKENGIEATLIGAVDLNTKNEDTEYQSGTQLHVEGALAQHFPLLGGFAGVGATAFWYDQITDDSGSGAVLGGFQARTTGVGPAISWAGKLGSCEIVSEVKWLPELETRNRLEGDYFWMKLVAKF